MRSVFLADVIKVVHHIILFFIWIGCFLPKRFLIYHIGLIILIQLQFITISDKCILTIWEDSLRGVPSSYNTYNSPFIIKTLRLLGINNIHIDSYFSSQLNTLLLFAISCIRLFILNK